MILERNSRLAQCPLYCTSSASVRVHKPASEHTPILFADLALPDIVQCVDLNDELIVVGDDILTFDVFGLVLLEQEQSVADDEETIENGLFDRVERYSQRR